MSIGAFARRTGLTASALRFYADSGLLNPSHVDPSSGYRFYEEGLLERAALLRRLRGIGMPLESAASVLDAGAEEAIRLVEDHVNIVVGDAAAVRQDSAAITAILRTALAPPAVTPTVSLRGPVFASAIEQALSATARGSGDAVLNGVRVEIDSDAVTLTATDRYRISTRSLTLSEPPASAWAATVHADDLRNCLPELRRTPRAHVETTEHGIWLRLTGRDDRHCRLVSEPFPDYRAMLAELPEVTARATASKTSVLRALEDNSSDRVALKITNTAVTVFGEQHCAVRIPASTTGPATEVWFETTTLYPAVDTALGPDVLIDMRSPDQPVTLRSADDGDLTTLVMPIRSPKGQQR